MDSTSLPRNTGCAHFLRHLRYTATSTKEASFPSRDSATQHGAPISRPSAPGSPARRKASEIPRDTLPALSLARPRSEIPLLRTARMAITGCEGGWGCHTCPATVLSLVKGAVPVTANPRSQGSAPELVGRLCFVALTILPRPETPRPPSGAVSCECTGLRGPCLRARGTLVFAGSLVRLYLLISSLP